MIMVFTNLNNPTSSKYFLSHRMEQGWHSGESAHLPPLCPGFDSRTWRHMWVEFVVGSLPCRGFSAGTPVFPSPQKPTFPNSNLIWNCQALYLEPLAQVIVQALPVFDVKFEFTIKFLIARILLYTCI